MALLIPEFTEYVYRIVGISPLMMHNPQGSMEAPTGGLGKKREVPTPDVEAERGAYRCPDGQLYIKAEAFRGSLLFGCKGYKVGKITAKALFVSGVMIADAQLCLLIHPETKKAITDYVVDTRRAVLKGGSPSAVAVMRSRPRIDKWETSIVVGIDETTIDAHSLEQIFQRAGRFQGVCDQRPGAPRTPGQFGMFAVELVTDGETTKRQAKAGKKAR